MSSLEIIGTALGIIGVWLMIRENVWGWPVGLVQVAVSAWIFYGAKLYSDAILQVFFFAIQAYGWWHWLSGADASHRKLAVTRLRVRGVVGWCAAGAVCTGVWGEMMRRTTDAALPYWDAFILVFSLIAQWWQARKRLECWAGWMAVNVVAVGVYWAKDLRLYAGLYAVFFAMAVAGHVAWRKSMSARANAETQARGKTSLEGRSLT
jgi:nicotinamide mononucleotide transporter